MNRMLQSWARTVSSRKGAAAVLIGWLLVVLLLSGLAPGAKPYAVSSGEGSIKDNTPSAVAASILKEQFPSEDGMTALLVFHGQQAISVEERAKINQISEWLSSSAKPEHISNALPLHHLPESAQNRLYSEDRTTLLLNVTLEKGLDSHQTSDTLEQIRTHVDQVGIGSLQMEITGPAGIAADTIQLFRNADFVLMFATIGLILVILVIIYRSPLLAVIPLVIAGIVYQVVDRILGLAGKNGWFVVDKQALSIMMILLFAVLTDYCLFIIARYKEEWKRSESKYEAMRKAMTQIAEPILFSGGTVLLAMVVLFTAVFKPYHNFAPVFSVAMVVIVLGGLTLIPAIFVLLGKKAFWPIKLRREEGQLKQPTGLWSKVGAAVTKKPGVAASVLLILFLLSSFSIGGMNYSFNLMKSFPSDISSRQGFDIMEQRFPQGQLAPVSVILQSDKEIVPDSAFISNLKGLVQSLKKLDGINAITPDITPELFTAGTSQSNGVLSQQKKAVKLQLTLQMNPYDQAALNVLDSLRDQEQQLLQVNGFDASHYSLHYAGQTAEQLDVRTMNERDTVVTFAGIALLITIMLAFQARSIVLALIMMGTMLLSYTATLGISWLVFHYGLGYDAISYRLPVYIFVFLIALGVDYNIMLVSRIREEAKHADWKEAVSRGVALTGGVISSAGIILAATFCVLITQPLQELFLFGFSMALGILLDTFLVRGVLLPAILTMIGDRSRSRKAGKSTGQAAPSLK